ncbi:AAA family ATPase [Streptomyces celluloflavus]|uniref:AAA family ATPase n=1 Tax=Streptomyces celluloflavus TaxID=58344 RepID=UPI0036BE01BF
MANEPAERAATELLLIERDRERAVLDSVITELGTGRPAVVAVTGRPGLGQHALLRWAARLAEDRGLRVRHARATGAERELRHGAVVQLTGPPQGPPHELPCRPDRLAGMTELLCAARSRPTLLVVEDTQWLDPASLQWFQALVRRLPGTPVALLVGSSGIPVHDTPLPCVADWPTAPAVRTAELALSPLSAHGVATAVELICGIAGDQRFTEAAAHLTAGHPAVLHTALRRFTGYGYAPVAGYLPELRDLVTAAAGDHTTGVLHGLPDAAVAVLRALAVCGGLLDLPLVCLLAGQRHLSETKLRAVLEASGFTTAGHAAPRVHDPLVRARILEEMPADERADLHARVAECAHRAAAADEDIAELLLHARPLGTPWAVPTLRRGSAAAQHRGEHAVAVARLSRALDEPLEPEERARLQFELAAAEAMTAPEAGDRRLAGITRAEHGVGRLRARATDLGLARGNSDWGRRTAAEAIPAAHGAERDGLIALYWIAEQTRQDDTELVMPEVPALPDRPADAPRAGVRAWQLALRGDDPDATRALARSALAGPADADSLFLPRLVACRALFLTDDTEEAERHLDALLDGARRHRTPTVVGRVLGIRAELHLRCGRIGAAERDITAAERALPFTSWHPYAVPQLLGLRLTIDLENGRRDQARALACAPTPAGAEDSVLWSFLLFGRALVAWADGEPAVALELLRECGRRLLRRQWINPALLPWRSTAARLAHTLGHRDEALQLSREELRLARRWGTASALGRAELGAAPAAGPARTDRLRTAVAVLRDSPARVAYAGALAELATAEREGGDRERAAELAAEAALLTAACPVPRLAGRVRLLATDLRGPAAPAVPEAPEHHGWDTLTEAERRTALLAGCGHGNRDIADLLSVSRRTVELRLSGVYKKLRISGRGELSALVRAMDGC